MIYENRSEKRRLYENSGRSGHIFHHMTSFPGASAWFIPIIVNYLHCLLVEMSGLGFPSLLCSHRYRTVRGRKITRCEFSN